jgi:hypothetical protein
MSYCLQFELDIFDGGNGHGNGGSYGSYTEKYNFYLQIHGLPTGDKNDILLSVYYVFLF